MMFQNCCCCIDLRVGTIIIAILEIIGGLCNLAGGRDWDNIVVVCASAVAGICLLYGAIRCQQIPILINLICHMTAILFWSTIVCLDYVELKITEGVLYLMIVFLSLYFWLCVFSFYRGLRAGTSRDGNGYVEI